LEIRKAGRESARDLAYLINLAGEGIPEYLWRGMIEGNESALDVGARRAARDEGGFSYSNARICVADGELLGMILCYRQPDPYQTGPLAELPEVVRPLLTLESRAPGSWYVNAIATFEQHRGKGVARALMADAEVLARAAGCSLISLIVASENAGARRLYQRLGFDDAASLPVVPYPGALHGGSWVLMLKRLA
jgi:ribosomal protein S18 acetylase RimI-like enzyme